MSLKGRIIEDMKSAMKEKNLIARDVLRVLKAEIERREQAPEGKRELTDGVIIEIIKKAVHDINITTCNKEEVAVLEVYLPKQLTELEIRNFAEKFVKTQNITSIAGMGTVMKHFKDNFDGQYDGKLLSGIVKELI